MKKRNTSPNEYFECVKFRRAWADEYRRTKSVEEWALKFPDQFKHEPRRGHVEVLRCFYQYALQYVLRERGIRHIALPAWQMTANPRASRISNTGIQ